MKYQILTENIPGWSLITLAKDMEKIAAALGHEVSVIHKINDIAKGASVINLMPNWAGALYEHKKFAGFEAITIMATNFEEYDPAQIMSIFYYTTHLSGLVLHSPYSGMRAKEFVKKTFSPSLAVSILSNVVTIPCGITDDFYSEGKNDKNKFIVPANRWAVHHKGLTTHSKVTEAVKLAIAAKYKKKTTHTFAYGSKFKEPKEKTPYTFVAQPETREEYFKKARGYGIFLSTANFESFGLYYLELLMSGVVGVFQDKQWNRLLLPEYKYRGAASDLPGIVLEVYENYEEAQDYLKTVVQPYIRENYSLVRFTQAVLNLFNDEQEQKQ